MRWGNCWIYAVYRHIRYGGYFILRASPFRASIIHAMHAHDLPEELEVSHYVPKQRTGKPMGWLMFDGKVMDRVGAVKPPKVNGLCWQALLFWASYFAGMGSLAWLVFNWIRG